MSSEPKNYYPDMPPALEGESDFAYTDRLTGADGKKQIPYNHKRFRQCSIGWHGECSDPDGDECECPCHNDASDPVPECREETCWCHDESATKPEFCDGCGCHHDLEPSDLKGA